MPVGVGSQRGHIAQQPVNLLIPELPIFVDILAGETWVLLGMESRQSSHSRAEHAHRMRIVSEGLHHIIDVAVHECMGHDPLCEGLQLGGSGKLAE
jgi:hypothetical protein